MFDFVKIFKFTFVERDVIKNFYKEVNWKYGK